MEDGWGNYTDTSLDLEGRHSNDDDDDDDSFVPDSLRAFLKAADQKLEDDLAGLLSPPAKKEEAENDDENNKEEEENSLVCDDLGQEAENSRKCALTRTAAKDQKKQDEQERRHDVLLDIIHPSANVTESHVKRIAMEGVESTEVSYRTNTSLINSDASSSILIVSKNLPIPSPMIGSNRSILSGTTGGSIEGVYSPSPPTNKKVGRKLQMELDREAQRSSLSPSSLLSSSNNIKNNDVNVITDDSNDRVKEQEQNKEQKLQLEKKLRLKELQSKGVERKKKLKELEDSRRNSLTNSTGKVIGNGNGSNQNAITNDDGNNNNNLSLPMKQQHEETLWTEKTKNKRYKEIPNKVATTTTKSVTSANNKGNNKTNQDNYITDNPRSTPSIAAIVSTNQGATVIATDAASGNNLRDVPEQFVFRDDVERPRRSYPSAKNETKITQKEPEVTNNSRDPVQRAQQRRKQQQHNQQRSQHRSFKARSAPSPPIPKELITTINYSGSDVDRSVSPLGTDRGLGVVVSPLGSGSPRVRNTLSSSSSQFSRRANRRKPSSVSTLVTRRRPLTRPDGNIDRLLKPTSASNASKIGVVKNKRQEAPCTKRSPEEEQRKARERVRARMDLQRKMSLRKKSKEGKLPQKTAANRNSAENQTNATRERLQRMEQTRLQKLKAKINAKEERLQTKMDNKNNKLKRTQQHKQRIRDEKENQNRPSVRRNKPTPTIPITPKFATDRRILSKNPTLSSSTSVNIKKKERASLASSADIFGQSLRETPTTKKAAQWSKRTLTIPKAPKLATSKRHGEKSTPQTSPQRKKKDFADDNMWSSTLRDVSGISPISKAASSVRTGPLTIPITPHFQSMRKRPLPKSTAEKEIEKIKYHKDNPFKARLVKISNISISVPSEVKKLTSSPRPVTTLEPFHLSACKHEHKHHEKIHDSKKEISFKARPMPDFSSNTRTSLGSKRSTFSSRPLTTVEPFQFHHTSKRNHENHSDDQQKKIETGSFKALPLPDFPSNRLSLGSKKSPSSFPPVTTSKRSNEKYPEDQQKKKENGILKTLPLPNISSRRLSLGSKKSPSSFRSLTTSKHSNEKDSEDQHKKKENGTLKALPLPNISSNRPLTTSKRSNEKDSEDQQKKKENGTLKTLPLPNISSNRLSFGSKKLPSLSRPLTTSKRSNEKNSEDQQKKKENGTLKTLPLPNISSNRLSLGSKKSPSLSRPLTTPEPFKFNTSKRSHEKKGKEIETFKARPMPDLSSTRMIPLTDHPSLTKKLTTTRPFHFATNKRAITHTPTIKKSETDTRLSDRRTPSGSSGLLFRRTWTTSGRATKSKLLSESKQIQGLGSPNSEEKKESTFRARSMPDFEKVSIPIQTQDPNKIRPPSSCRKEEDEVDVMTPAIKAKPVPKTMSEEPSIFVRMRSPNKLRSSESVRIPVSTLPDKKPEPFCALPVPSFLSEEPSISVRRRDPKKLRSPESIRKPVDTLPEKKPEPFCALPAPSFLSEEPLIRVRHRDPTKIRSPENLNDKKPEPFCALPVPIFLSEEPSICVRRRDPNKLRGPESVRKPISTLSKKIPEPFCALPAPSFLDNEPLIPVRRRDPTKLCSPEISNHSRKESTLLQKGSSKLCSRVKPQNKKTQVNVMYDAKARLRERLSKRKNNTKKQENITRGNFHIETESNEILRIPNCSNKITTSTDNTPVKSNTMPISIDLQPGSRSPKERRKAAKCNVSTPQISNNSRKDTVSNTSEKKDDNDVNHSHNKDTERDAKLERQATLACALVSPHEDESSSILQLAQEVQRAAEDELSFYGSLDTLEREFAFS